jgi:uncharacterized membrane protein (UPF0127 family)
MKIIGEQDTLTTLLALAFKTALAYGVFFVFLFTVPVFNIIKAKVTDNSLSQKHVVIGDVALNVNIADSNSERVEGLSGKSNLHKNEGLFFIFDVSDYHGIWMKDMEFPIDIIWLDANKQVIYFEQNIHPNTYPTVFKPTKKAKYVLEVQSGFIKREGIKVGDQLTLL